jgi:hypothetical protein
MSISIFCDVRIPTILGALGVRRSLGVESDAVVREKSVSEPSL